MQGQSQQSAVGSTGNADQTQFTNWIKGLDDPTQLKQVLKEVGYRIHQLPQSARQDIATDLRNDVRFSEFSEMFTRQTA